MKRRNAETSIRRKASPLRGGRSARPRADCDGSTLRWFDAARTAHRGFTLLEVLAVVVILGVLATIMVPRLLDHQDRLFNLTCDRVADLLTMYAQRESLGQKPVGLSYDPDRRWLLVMVYDVDEGAAHHEPYWRHDPLIRPVKLPDIDTAELLEIRGDGRVWDTTVWPLANRPGQERPSIEVVLQGPSRAVNIVLPPYAVAPRLFDLDDPAVEVFTPIDLNAAGRSRQDW